MRLAVVTEHYRPTVGGIQEHVFHFARSARALGHDVTVVTGRIDGYDGEPHVVRLGRSEPIAANGSTGRVTLGTSLRSELESLLTPERFDLVHLHAPFTPVLPVVANRSTRLPLVATHHTNLRAASIFRLFTPMARALASRIDVHIGVSRTSLAALAPYAPVEGVVVPNGVDVASWSAGRPDDSLRNEAPVLLFVGRLEPRSGLERLLDAAALLPDLDPLVLVVGDGPLRTRFEARAAGMGLRTRFVGACLDERPDLYASADVLVCPTHIASFGVTLLEGMAAGLPLVASDIDGFREVVTHGVDGLLVDTADASKLSRAIRRLLTDARLTSALALAGRVTAARHDWSLVTGRVLDVYRAAGLTA